MKRIWREHITLAHLANEEDEVIGIRRVLALAWYDEGTKTLRIELSAKDFSIFSRASFQAHERIEPMTILRTVSSREEAYRYLILNIDRYVQNARRVLHEAQSNPRRDAPSPLDEF